MRTTLEIDDDLVLATKELASQRGVTMGRVVSQLLRKALEPGESPRIRNGVPLFSPNPGAPKATMALVNRIRDEEE